jgi:predicted ATPase
MSVSTNQDLPLFVRHVELLRERVSDFSVYPFCLPAVGCLTTLRIRSPVTFFIGENGSGKSTLLEAIAIAWGFNPEGGSKNFQFATRQSHSDLSTYLRLRKGSRRPSDGFFFRAESFYNVATEVERLGVSGYGEVGLHNQSHGEAFLALLMHRFRGDGLYVLDEPEAALSPQRQLAVLSRLHQLVLGHSQFIIATHSPILMAYPDATIFNLDARGIVPVSYEETEHFLVMQDFLAHPDRSLRALLREE